MAAASSAGAASTLALETHGGPFSDFSAEASSSSSSTSYTAALGPVACNSSGEEGVLDLDSPWLASVEAESRLEAAAKDTSAALVLTAEAEGEDEIRDNRQRQEDELMALEAIYGDDLAVFENKGGLRYFQVYIRYDLPDGIEVGAKLSSANATPRDMLDTIWAELPDQEVIYQWVEWLRNSSISYIWFDGRMMLGPDIVTHNGDNRAISRTLSLESVIPLMLSYSSKKRHQAFLEDLHMCMICLNQSKGSNFARLPCQHLFCLKCMETLCRMHVKEGSVFQLACSSEIIGFDVRCCLLSKGPCHPGKQCLTPEQKIQRRQASGRMTEKEAAQELLNIRELYKDVRLCPKCGMAIAKTEGCNKMVCGSCGQYFCFRCGKAITGYEHFRDEGNCQLFAAREILEWERQMEAMDIGHRMRISSCPIGGTVRCPKCRATNFKEDERYIFCWSCRADYCTLCRRKVESKRKGHYGSPECVGLN
ncbi:hypothetical protein QOZ80_4AG0305510 [Eleusine coracana subsp. coracana]|nr:hypothetical protein QOZ80_4AG0305510 [Eleusine coracana subsp. coracana]